MRLNIDLIGDQYLSASGQAPRFFMEHFNVEKCELLLGINDIRSKMNFVLKLKNYKIHKWHFRNKAQVQIFNVPTLSTGNSLEIRFIIWHYYVMGIKFNN